MRGGGRRGHEEWTGSCGTRFSAGFTQIVTRSKYFGSIRGESKGFEDLRVIAPLLVGLRW